MEILVTIAYFCLVWLIFYRFRLMRFNLFWKFIVFGLYGLAALTEIVLLGQTTPYSKELIVERYVIQLAPEFGGLVSEVHTRANVPLKRGDPIFSMDAAPWQDRFDKAKADQEAAVHQRDSVNAELAAANRLLYDAQKLVPKKLMAAQQLDIRRDKVEGLQAKLASTISNIESLQAEQKKAQYNLDHATIVAPTDGYLVSLVLRPGAFIRIKSPVAAFVSTDEVFLIASINHRASQWIRAGDKADFALSMYPGEVFKAEVNNVIWASSSAQIAPSGTLPSEASIKPSEAFYVRLKPIGDHSKHPLRFGSNGITAIYTNKAADVFQLIRKIEIQSESLLNYIYNPF